MTFLSRLRLYGFKSYAEEFIVEFGEQIAVVIGSNGVGKSNSLDAMLWALGEDNPRAMRCRNRRDLLFAGSSEREPAEEALVELTFDRNGEEIVVGRSMNRSEAERFTVQGEEVPDLDQYRAQLERLGFGDCRFNVIRQEELTDFFAKSDPDRRAYIEQFTCLDGDPSELNEKFDRYIGELIPHSSARLFFDEDDGDLDVEVVFGDKGAKRGIMLSGGERAATSLALKLALFESKPSPLYLLDEVEPSLDWARNNNMQGLFKKLSKDRQLVLITHTRSTVEIADTVHGVRVRSDGASWLKFHFLMDERLLKVYRCCG